MPPIFTLNLPEGNSKPAESTPLVVVMGWYGAQDRHVAVYSSLLNKEGYATLRTTLPGLAVFSPLSVPRRRYAADLLDCLDGLEPTLGQRKIVFYTFSNGGCFLLEQVDELVHSTPRYTHLAPRIAKTIFDSAPCYMHHYVGAAAVGAGRSLPIRLLASLFFYLSVAVMLLLSPFRTSTYWQNMQGLRIGTKSLYLYSADDPLCDHNKLDELVAARRRTLGDARVAAVKWQRSQHVAHIRHHGREYRAALFDFLQTV